MDRENTIASSVSIRNGHFSTVDGARADAASGNPRDRSPKTHRRTGIIDNHNHIVLMGIGPASHLPLENASSVTDVQELVAARPGRSPPGVDHDDRRFHRNQFFPPDANPRLPDPRRARHRGPDNPVYISESFMGPSPRTVAPRRSSSGRRRPSSSAKTARLPQDRRRRAAPRWHCGTRC